LRSEHFLQFAIDPSAVAAGQHDLTRYIISTGPVSRQMEFVMGIRELFSQFEPEKPFRVISLTSTKPALPAT